MSGGPPHHPHNRQVPAANTAWNHLQVPNFFPRQPQLAHMSNEHSLLHQPTWHTPTATEAMKIHPHTHMLSEMLKNDPLFPRDCVDLSLTRNGNQNGELPTTPISLSVRDTNKINSLPASVLDIQAVELTKCTSPNPKPASPVLKSASPVVKAASPGLKSMIGPGVSTQVLPPATTATPVEVSKTQKRSNIRVDSILERLNTTQEKAASIQENKVEQSVDKSVIERPTGAEKVEKAPPTEKPVSVIVQPASSYDENSNSSSIVNVPTSTCIREEDAVSSYSNEDSLDSNKSRRKRKPSKTIRVSKDDEKLEKVTIENFEPVPEEPKLELVEPEKEPDPVSIVEKMLEENKIPERRRSSDDLEAIIPAKTRRKTSSESETIDNIAAMVQEGLKAKQVNNMEKPREEEKTEPIAKPISVSVIKTKDNLTEALSDTLSNSSTTLVTPAQKKATNTHFVEVENKLEEMFAGIEDSSDPLKTDALDLDDSKLDDPLLKLDDPLPSTSQENVTVSSTTEVKKKSPSPKKNKRKQPLSRRNSDATPLEITPKKKKISKKTKAAALKAKAKSKKSAGQKQNNIRTEPVKDVYAYDSGSNASSSRSRGPFIQIRGPRDSPLSVSVVNTPINDDDGERKTPKTKKFHDDSEYRHKVRSKGLHCSTLSNKYDAQTKDATWICTFCKRGPHASELSGPSSNGEIIPPGDLFGPYFITAQCPEFERRLDDPHDKQFKSKKITRVLEDISLTKSSAKKSKRKYPDSDQLEGDQSDIYLGITETGNETFEVWAHEDCIVWSPGIYLVGPKIIGLEEAVWTSCNVPCKLCNLKGANICCLKRGCLNTMHLCCARSNDWQFLEVDFKAYCPQHRVP